jgi:TPR repeat protein
VTAADLRLAAEGGNVDAQVRLGRQLYDKEAPGCVTSEAPLWFRRAAEKNNAYAALMLGLCYRRGIGVPASDRDAFIWFSRAAEAGYRDAAVAVANCYKSGRGVAVDWTRAAEWYRSAAARNHYPAADCLGAMYRAGKGVPKDPRLSAHWTKLAAEGGYAPAQRSLGSLYAVGAGVPRDYAEAERYYRLAAAQGDPYACHALRILPFVRNPILRQRFRVEAVVGYAFLAWYAATTRFSFAILPVLIGLAVTLAIAMVATLVVWILGSKGIRREVEELEAHDPDLRGWGLARQVLLVLGFVPAEDGLFFVPVLWAGITPVSAAVSSALFAASHYPRFTWRLCVGKAFIAFALIWFVLPNGVWTVTATHLLIDLLVVGFEVALQRARKR